LVNDIKETRYIYIKHVKYGFLPVRPWNEGYREGLNGEDSTMFFVFD